MDTHISELLPDQASPDVSRRAPASLPGETGVSGGYTHPHVDDRTSPAGDEELPPAPDGPAVFANPGDRLSAGHPSTEPLTTGRPPSARRRRLLVGSVAVVAVAGAAVFALSPYNTMFPLDASHLRTQGMRFASSALAPVTDLVAPAAKVARAPQPLSEQPPPERPVSLVPHPDEDLRELLALRNGVDLTGADAAGKLVPPSPAVSTPLAAGRPSLSPSSAAVDHGGPGPRSLETLHETRPANLMAFETGAGPSSSVPAPSTSTVSPAQSAVPTQPAPPSPVLLPAPAAEAPLAESHASAVLHAAQPPNGASELHTGITLPTAVVGVATQSDVAPSVLATNSSAASVDAPPRELTPSRRLSALPDAATIASELRAAPMTPAQQVDVLNLVTQLGVVVRDMKAENAALKNRVESTADRFDIAVTEFDRRLALAEARGAVNAAMGVPASPAPVEPPPPVTIRPARLQQQVVPNAPSRVSLASATTPSAPSTARYRVTAASPGLAMLSLLDRSGGEGSQIQVGVGDQVPGYGRVTAILQRGSAWVVQTDKGPDKGAIQ